MKTHKRVLMELSTRYWALHPDKLEQVTDFVATQLGGGKSPVSASEVFEDSGQDVRNYDVQDGVAIIPLTGVMDRRMNLFQAISGGTSSQQLAARIREAASDNGVTGLLLDIDSPGGSVFAIEEIAEAVQEAKAIKPVIAHSYGQCCSAAYWVGSQADRFVIGSNAEVGSIGVVYVHYDRSEQDRTKGVSRTIMTAGKYKRIAGDAAPLSSDGAQYIQEQLDTYYSLFVDAVAQGRGVSANAVLSDMAEGRTFIGEQALKAGLVDEIGTIEHALALARGKRSDSSMPTPEQNDSTLASHAQTPLSASALAESSPDAVAQIAASAVQEERSRVMEIFEAGASKELTASALRDGTSPKDFFRAALHAQKTEQNTAEQELAASLPPSAGQDGKSKDTQTQPGFMDAVRTYARDNQCSMTHAVKSVVQQNPKLHAAYLHSLEDKNGDV